MSTFISAVRTFIADEDGVTAIEYGLIAALIAGAVVLSVTALGGSVKGIFDQIAGEINKI